MPSIVDLCNIAISYCGTRSKIASLTEGSKEANACQTHLHQARVTSLRAFDWNFARITAKLAQISIPIPTGQTVAPTSNVRRWRYEYAVPVDCLRIRRLGDRPVLISPVAWFELAMDKDALGNPISVVYTNDPIANLVYTADVQDPNRWDAGFFDAVSYGLAHRICYEITGKEERVKPLLDLWQGSLWTAAAQSANENPSPMTTWVPEGLQARGYDDGQAEIGQAWPRSPG